MAAVAGAGGGYEVLRAICATAPASDKAYVNNGGDVAFHLEPGTRRSIAVIAGGQLGRRITITHADAGAPRVVDTSGWRGRSHSFGIADSP